MNIDAVGLLVWFDARVVLCFLKVLDNVSSFIAGLDLIGTEIFHLL